MAECVSPQLQCPECGSHKIWKAGFRQLPDGKRVQRYKCGDCRRRWSGSSSKALKELDVTFKAGSVASQLVPKSGKGSGVNFFPRKKSLNDPSFSGRKHKEPHVLTSPIVSLSEEYLNTLYPTGEDRKDDTATVKEMAQKLELQMLPPNIISELVEFAWYLKKEGRSENTIKTYSSTLRTLVLLGADLHNPDSVKEALAKAEVSNNTKASIVTAYSSLLNWLHIDWRKPAYRYEPKIPFIPLERELDQLIAGSGKKMSALQQLLKETGMRIGEAQELKWTDVNTEARTVSVNHPEKHSLPRILNVSAKCIAMLEALPKTSDRVFGDSSKTCKSLVFKEQRERLAKKLGNPRLGRITFHTFRHWKATMEYHKTKDILHVKQMLGHKNIQSTLIYITLERAVFTEAEDQFISKVAHNVMEAQKLVEVGFEFVCDFGAEGKLFRKRK